MNVIIRNNVLMLLHTVKHLIVKSEKLLNLYNLSCHNAQNNQELYREKATVSPLTEKQG